jgi:hypothetical protein
MSISVSLVYASLRPGHSIISRYRSTNSRGVVDGPSCGHIRAKGRTEANNCKLSRDDIGTVVSDMVYTRQSMRKYWRFDDTCTSPTRCTDKIKSTNLSTPWLDSIVFRKLAAGTHVVFLDMLELFFFLSSNDHIHPHTESSVPRILLLGSE